MSCRATWSPDADLVPRAADAEPLITPRTRAIVLVTPGNPSGVTIPPAEIAAFAALARRHDIALILDETYRTFRDTRRPAHPLFADPAWRWTLVSLHSFSKDLAIPGYRVGCVVASPELNREVIKLMDCVAICAPRVGQEAALAGLTRRRDVAAGAGRGGRAAPGLAGRGPGRPAGRVRGRLARRVLRLGPAPLHRPPDVGRRAGPRPQARHARHPRHGVPARRPPDVADQRGRIDEAGAATLARRLTAAGR